MSSNGLETEWIETAPEYEGYASLIASDERVLVTTTSGEVVLIDALAAEYRSVSRIKVPDDSEVTAHPAIVGDRLIVRTASQIFCMDLATEAATVAVSIE